MELTWQVNNNHTCSLIAAATCKPPRSAFRTRVKFQKAYLAQIWHSLTDKQHCAVFARQKSGCQTLWLFRDCSGHFRNFPQTSRVTSFPASLFESLPSIHHHPSASRTTTSKPTHTPRIPATVVGTCDISSSAPPSFRNGFYLPILDVPSTLPRKLTTIARSYSVTSAH